MSASKRTEAETAAILNAPVAEDEPPAYVPEGWIAMRHPEIAAEDYALVTKEAFDLVWQRKGWVEIDPNDKTNAASGEED